MNNYPLASSSWGDEEISAIQSVIDSDMYSMGSRVAEYEQQFSQVFGSKYTVMTSSGSTANLLMIAALFYTKNPLLKKGDEVIVPAVSWSTTYFPLQQYGLNVKFVDIDADTLNIDLERLELAITNKTKAILAVNLLGNSCDFNKIKTIIGNRNILLLEDNCESMGATLDNQQAGTFGLMGTFSSFFSHHMSTMEGGCVVTDNEELYHVLLCIRAHGWTRDLPKNNLITGTKSDDPFEESFKFVLPGYNVRPLEMSGAIGIEQLKKLPAFIEKRRDNATYFQKLFSNSANFMIQKETGNSSWFGFSLVIKEGANIKRSIVVKKLLDNGIECRPIVTGNFVKNDVIKYFDYQVSGILDNANYIDKNGFFVGNHPYELKESIFKLHQLLEDI